jgi:rhomboid protease GluP
MIAVLVVIWVAMTAAGRSLTATEDQVVLTRWGGLARPDLWQSGEYWRLLTATFLHIGAAHLVMNSLGLWAVGRLVEWWFGAGRMLVIYLLAGVAGFVLSAVAGPPAALSAGASGAIMGLLGALVWFRYASPLRDRLPGKPFFLVLAATVVSDGVLFYMMDNWAHFGGFAGGLIAAAVVGLPLLPGVARPRFRFHWAAHVAAALVLLLLTGATLAGAFDLPGPGHDLARALDAAEAGRLPEAEAGLRRAVERQGDEPWLRLLLSHTLLREGNCRAARTEWQEARELGAEESDLQDLDRDLRHCGV